MTHIPVMLNQCVKALVDNESGKYLDATFGAGGHSRAILDKLSAKGRLIGFDQDSSTLGNAFDDPRCTLIHSNFRYIDRFAKLYKLDGLDGILADLGFSSMQIDSTERGFSFRFDAPLDMRMSQQGETAADFLKKMSEEELVFMFSRYGEVRNSKTLAKVIVERRHNTQIDTVGDLMSILEQWARGDRRRYFAQVFQALRIQVNDEMNALQDFLEQSYNLLKPGGKLVVLTYHSLEDRLVKYFMKYGNAEGQVIKDDFGNIFRPYRIITKKPPVPDEDEIKINPRARSAKLRVAEKI